MVSFSSGRSFWAAQNLSTHNKTTIFVKSFFLGTLNTSVKGWGETSLTRSISAADTSFLPDPTVPLRHSNPCYEDYFGLLPLPLCQNDPRSQMGGRRGPSPAAKMQREAWFLEAEVLWNPEHCSRYSSQPFVLWAYDSLRFMASQMARPTSVVVAVPPRS